MPISHSHHPPLHSHAEHSTLGRLLDLDAEIHEDMLNEALDLIDGHLGGSPVRRVLDVGAGTGTGTFSLSSRYPEAEVIALDANPSMTQQIDARVAGQRITTLNRPLSAMGLDAGSVDLAWASSVFHEFDDVAGAFAALSEAIHPGGLLAILEMDGPPRVLPNQYDELESRLRSLAHADAPQTEWSSSLRAAGFELLQKHTLLSDQELPGDGVGGDYARMELRRLAHHAAHGLNPDQSATLSQILDSVPGTPALPKVHIRGTRTMRIARRR